ncbi:formylglycine-generating enzyme family protein [Microbacterium esteraromaticum]|uniref:formylglycine-generating enzyme family protein n=1 Tax=Microbacterium esteraromaticum TaxID=57043 RepID=UPI0021BD1F89|nr:formylglycine-generating enzyme family protein [Microbacterium esteraromaticum]
MGDSSGDENPGDGETLRHRVTLPAFSIDATTVTNDAFAAFVDDTGYATEAEAFGFSAVFYLGRAAPDEDVLGAPSQTPWWQGVRGADWRHPGGAWSSIEGLADHPATHISWNDAVAHCVWAGRRLPSEAEWEHAARGSIDDAKYPWGDAEVDEDGWRANIFQGEFPVHSSVEDGWATTAPVRSYTPSGYGLWQDVGNVWEWCADWYDPADYSDQPILSPVGPTRGRQRVLRGGSYLCHNSYCNRCRNSARSQNTPNSSMVDAGFRTVAV